MSSELSQGGEKSSDSAVAYRNSSLYKLAASPYPEWTLSALCAASVPIAAKAGSGFPHFGVMMGFSAIWAGSGYMKYAKDPDNGSGTTTAWCLTYLFLNLRRTVRQPKPMPSLVAAGVLTNLVISGRKVVEVEFGV
ncbi:hypothetical protein BC939DRAFT_530165 [Gamsiella multidivaricata]|uniref:uncharacterized protein n=1 Tax=Gamsiella multidivaricata TaxID=101098 RepID=UPI0022210EAC|nr:uncharacterized protein BC939DRAFT_530165 [Gamsiella multidivaricata]KAG0364563.1 hypothetical protein BGZ54_007364 [Gamsiella multidivaricata]KAI7821234.1 hypothetical protein BC939DRAFT_530165 [Gamsiella multidivaricata]